MIWTAKFWLRSGALVVALAAAGSLAPAQEGPKGAAPPAADAGLQKRVEQIEEQLVDMQVILGTLESLARGTTPPPSAAPGGAVGGNDLARLDAVETQIQALAAQLENLQEQLRKLSARMPDEAGSDTAKSDGTTLGEGTSEAPPPLAGFGDLTVDPAAPKKGPDPAFSSAARPGGTGSGPPPLEAAAPPPGGGLAGPDPQPQKLYERGYGFLLQKDYGAAESTFEDFLRRHPDHHLAGNAQYWLGETFYVRGQYRPAAAAFLKGYKSYVNSQKAPETLLKLAMSLHRLGQKSEACSSFDELATRFPDPPAHVRSLSRVERKRSGC